MRKLILGASVGVPALLAATGAKAFIVFAPAAFAGVVIGSIAFGALTTALFGHAWIAPFEPPVIQPYVETTVQPVVQPVRRHYHVYRYP
jgi:hypothetical protein